MTFESKVAVHVGLIPGTLIGMVAGWSVIAWLYVAWNLYRLVRLHRRGHRESA